MKYVYYRMQNDWVHVFPTQLTNESMIYGGLDRLVSANQGMLDTYEHLGRLSIHTNMEFNNHGIQIGAPDDDWNDLDEWYWGQPIYIWVGEQSSMHVGTTQTPTLKLRSIESTQEEPGKDFTQRYLDTYIRASYPGSNGVEVIYIRGVVGSGTAVVVSIQSLVSNKKLEILLSDLKIVENLPANKYINTEHGHAVLYLRLANRQWRRGVCENTFSVYYPGNNHIAAIKRTLHGTPLAFQTKEGKPSKSPLDFVNKRNASAWTFKNMLELFDPNYPGYHKAWKSISKGTKYSVAFTPTMYLSASPKSENFILGMGKIEVADVSSKTPDEIIVTEPLMHQEVVDMVRRLQLTTVNISKR